MTKKENIDASQKYSGAGTRNIQNQGASNTDQSNIRQLNQRPSPKQQKKKNKQKSIHIRKKKQGRNKLPTRIIQYRSEKHQAAKQKTG